VTGVQTCALPISASGLANSLIHDGNTIENLIGGPDNDSFNFMDGAALASGDATSTTATIDARGGTADLLNYTAYSAVHPVVVDLSAHSATGLTYVQNIENVTGGSGSDTLTGDDNNNVLTGGPGNDTLTGLGADDDYYFFNNWGSDTVVETSAGGADVLSFYAYQGDTITYTLQPVTANLDFRLDNAKLWDTVTDTGNPANQLRFSAQQIEYAISGEGFDSLYTLDQNSSFNIDGVTTDTDPLFTLNHAPVMVAATDRNTYMALADAYNLEFMNFERIFAGSQQDTFTLVEDVQNYIIRGGAGEDTLIFMPGAQLGGPMIDGQVPTFDGQGGGDTLDYSNLAVPVSVDLSRGLAQFVNGGVIGNVIGSVINVSNLIGGSANDTLIGDAGNNLLVGGPGNDFLDGREGNDRYGYGDGWGSRSWGSENWDVDTLPAVDLGNDTLDFSRVSATHPLDMAFNTGSILVTDRSNPVGNRVQQAGNAIENFIGSQGDDHMIFADGAVVGGYVDGQGGADLLDFSAFTTPRDVVLTGLGLIDGFNGQETSILGGFLNINRLTGGTAQNDSLTGINAAADWWLDGSDQYQSGNTLDFADFEVLAGGANVDHFHFSGARTYHILRGGPGDDAFIFAPGALLTLIKVNGIAGYIDGQGGSDWMDYSAWTANVSVDLPSGSATSISNGQPLEIGSLINIENAMGGSGNDTFISDANDNTFIGNAGDDLYIFRDGWGNDNVADTSGANDRVDLSSISLALTFLISASGVNVNGSGKLTVTGNTIEKLMGGKGDDVFAFEDGSTLASGGGTIDGGGGINRLDYSLYTTPVNVALADAPAFGTITTMGLTTSLTHIQNVYGGLADDTLSGNSEDNVFRGGAGNDTITGGAGSDTLDESNVSLDLTIDLRQTTAQNTGLGMDTLFQMENVRTGSGNDQITANSSSNLLDGGLGNDTYRFADGWGMDTVFDLGGEDVIDYSLAAGDLAFNLDASTVTSGASTLSFSGSTIETLVGGSGSDTFSLSGAQSYVLRGGAGNDRFVFSSAAVLTGSVDGEGGADILDYGGYNSARVINLAGVDVSGFYGTETSITTGFHNIDGLVGSGFHDELHGLNLASTWNLASVETVTTGGQTLTFSAVEDLYAQDQADTFNISANHTGSLYAGAGDDVFNFSLNAALTGAVNAGTGLDVLNYNGYAGPVHFVLTAAVPDGFNGTASNLSGGFFGINSLVGSSSLADSLTGLDAGGVWQIEATGNTYTNGSQLAFHMIENLVGGTGNDTFNFASGAVLEAGQGTLDGAGGTDEINYSAYATSVTVNLALGTATGTAGISHIENVTGGSGNDDLTGDTQNNILRGSLGDDAYHFLNGWGADTILENAGEGSDTVDFAQAAVPLFFNFDVSYVTVTDTANILTVPGTTVENFNGGSASDIFHFADGASVAGSLNGKEGSNTLDFSAYTTARGVRLDALGSLNGFQGTADGIGGRFDNMNYLTGSQSLTDNLRGADLDSVWTLGSSLTYAVGGRIFTFEGVEQLLGNAHTDRFNVSAPFSGSLAGGGGYDTLDLSAMMTARSVQLTGASVDGFSGSEAVLTGGFTGIDAIYATSASDHLTGADLDATWWLGGNSQVQLGSRLLDFYNFELLTGGAGVDTFEINGTRAFDLEGGAGSDRFHFADGAYLNGRLDGQTGSDTLDLQDFTHSQIVNLTAPALAGEGFNGYVAGVLIGFSSIDWLKAPSAPSQDTLQGANLVSDWVLDGNNRYQAGGNTVAFDGFEILVGGNQTDTFSLSVTQTLTLMGGLGDDLFRFSNHAELNGTVDGGSSVSLGNTIDYSAYIHGVDVHLQDSASTGTLGVFNIQNIIGSGFIDTLWGDSDNNVINGRGGSDDMRGGPGDDRYVFDNNWGAVDLDTILETDAGGFDTLDFNLFGSDLLFAINPANVVITSGTSQVTVTGNAVEQLLGGAGNDTFKFNANDVKLANGQGRINGGGGINTLDYTLYTTPVTVNLALGSATGLASGIGKVTNIQRVLGGSGNDSLTGSSVNEYFNGGSGDDAYYFAAGWGGDTLEDPSGNDTIDFAGASNDLIFTIASTGLQAGDGANTLTVNGNIIEHLVGGLGNDTFRFAADGVKLAGGNGQIDGGAGSNTLDYSAYTTTPVSVNLAAHTATGTAGVYNIQNVIAGAINEIFGDNGSNTFVIDGGSNIIHGLGGDDTYIFKNTWGTTSIDETGGLSGGYDILDFSQVTLALNYIFNGTGWTASDGVNTASGSYNVEKLIGSASALDTLDMSAAPMVRNVRLTGLGTSDGFKGAVTNAPAFDFDNVNVIRASSLAGDSLTGMDADADWQVAASQQYTSTRTLDFSAFETLIGGSAADTFHIAASAPASTWSLQGGNGSDAFVFAPGAVLNGSIDGQSGSDTLQYGSYGSAVAIALSGAGSADGLNGSGTGLSGAFANIDVLIGGGLTGDVLTGANAVAVWTLNGASRLVTYGSRSMGYSGFTTVRGGAAADTFNVTGSTTLDVFGGTGDDTFNFSALAMLTGILDGQAGVDSLVLSDYGASSTVTLTGLGATDGFNGLSAAVSGGFANINNLAGSTSGDRLVGMNADASWTVNSATGGMYASGGRSLSFTNFANLAGGSSADTLAFGGGSVRSIMLDSQGAVDGYNIREAGFSGLFENINILTGGAGTDSLTGLNTDSTWQINGAGGNLYTSGTRSLSFSAVENLSGGSGADTFRFAPGAVLAGAISGGMGSDTLDYSSFSSAVAVNLTLNGAAADGFSGTGTGMSGFGGIDRLVGGAGSDQLIGRNTDARFEINAANAGQYLSGGFTLDFSSIDNLTGGTANDTFAFLGSGSLAGRIHGGASAVDSDWLDYSAYDSAVNIDLTTGLASGIYNFLAGGVSAIENLSGSRFNDMLLRGDGRANILLGNAGNDVLEGMGGDDNLNGGAGDDTLRGGDGSDRYTFENDWETDLVYENAGQGSNDLMDFSAVTRSLDVTLNGTIRAAEGLNNLVTHAGMQVETILGGQNNDLFSVNANHSAVLLGGLGDDTFVVNNGALLTGSVDGQVGADVLSYAGFGSAANVTLTAAGSTDGFNGLGSGLSGGFANINRIDGGPTVNDSLRGTNLINDWALNGAVSQVTSGAAVLSFTGFENLLGGTQADTFHLNAAFTGSLDGQGGSDVLDAHLYGSPVTLNLTGIGSLDGFNGTLTGLSGTFANMNTAAGTGTPADTLAGLVAAGGTWTIGGASHQVSQSGRTLDFSGFGRAQGGAANDQFNIHASASIDLMGGAGDDTFNFSSDAVLTGLLDGQSGADLLNVSSSGAPVTVTLTGMGTTDGFNASALFASTIANINNLAAPNSTGDRLVGADLNGAVWTVNGGGSQLTAGSRTIPFAGFDILQGGALNDTFNIVSVNNPFDLLGGAGDDHFVFANNSRLGGRLDGQTGVNTLDYGAFTTARTVILTGADADGFAGAETDTLGGGFSHINVLAGALSLNNDRLNGLDQAASWNVNGSSSSYTAAGLTLAFRQFETLSGRSAADTFQITGAQNASLFGNAGDDRFVFDNGAALTGIIRGGTGIDTLDYNAYTTLVDVDLVSDRKSVV
jgi:hypothetical protein